MVDDDAVVFGRDGAFLGKVVSVLLGEECATAFGVLALHPVTIKSGLIMKWITKTYCQILKGQLWMGLKISLAFAGHCTLSSPIYALGRGSALPCVPALLYGLAVAS